MYLCEKWASVTWNNIIVEYYMIGSYQQWRGKTLGYCAKVVPAQSEVGQLDEGRKCSRVYITFTQQISFQLQDHQVIQVWRTESMTDQQEQLENEVFTCVCGVADTTRGK